MASGEIAAQPSPGARLASGAGSRAAQAIASAQVDAVVAGDFGPKAAAVLRAAQVEMIAMEGLTVRQALAQLRAGRGGQREKPEGQALPTPSAAGALDGATGAANGDAIRVAVAADDGRVAGHFGRCQAYVIADVGPGQVGQQSTLPNPGHEPGRLPRLLADHGVRRVIAGGMGQRAQDLFAQAGIACTIGARGQIDTVLAALARGELAGGDSTCSHDRPDTGSGHVGCEHNTNKREEG